MDIHLNEDDWATFGDLISCQFGPDGLDIPSVGIEIGRVRGPPQPRCVCAPPRETAGGGLSVDVRAKGIHVMSVMKLELRSWDIDDLPWASD